MIMIVIYIHIYIYILATVDLGHRCITKFEVVRNQSLIPHGKTKKEPWAPDPGHRCITGSFNSYDVQWLKPMKSPVLDLFSINLCLVP